MGGLAEAPVPQPPACPSSWPAPKLASICCEPGTSLEAVSRTDTALPVSTRSAEGRPVTRCTLCTRPPQKAVRPASLGQFQDHCEAHIIWGGVQCQNPPWHPSDLDVSPSCGRGSLEGWVC